MSDTNCPIDPIFDRLVVRRVERDEKTEGGIIKPDISRRHDPEQYRVVAVGDGMLIPQTGEQKPLKVGPGDIVYATPENIQILRVDREKWGIIRQDDILGIYNP
jgi:chaperonin GroES